MRNISATLGLTALLLTAPLLKANALTVQIDVGPTNIQTLPYIFAFTNKERDGRRQIGVTITPKKDKLSPGLLARLHLFDAKTEVAVVPLEETREGGAVTYWFQIAPALLAKSRFEFDVLSGVEEKLPDGKTRFVAEPGTLIYYFNLRDYIITKTALKPSAKTGNSAHIRIGNIF
jgi:hypothetical protein